MLTFPGLKKTLYVPSVWMCSTGQFPHHVVTTSAEHVLKCSGRNKSSSNVLFVTSFSAQDLIYGSITF